jgi:hypothetical protein
LHARSALTPPHHPTLTSDWIDSPFVGQGAPPPEGVDVYLSFYVDRIIAINEQECVFVFGC